MMNRRDSRSSVNSCYANLIDTSGVVIEEQQEGSINGLPDGSNLVTNNLLKCKRQMIHPYYKMLSLIAWKPFAANAVRFHHFWSFVNFVYPVFVICLLMSWYVARFYTCIGKKYTQTPTAIPTREPFLTTAYPSNASSSWSILLPQLEFQNSSKFKPTTEAPNYYCRHLFGIYIMPDIFYFASYLLGLYIFRFHDGEGFYALMEKVYLQSNNQQQITRTLRIYLYLGIFWLLCSACVAILFRCIFTEHTTGSIPDSSALAQYSFIALLVIGECASNCVIVSVIISHAGQCQLLKYYLEGIMNRLEEKSTELRYIMKDILDVRQNLSRINGLLSFNAACVIFNVSVMALMGFLRFFTNPNYKGHLWIFQASFFVLWSSILAFGVIQPARLTTCGARLKDKSLAIRVFGYRTHTQLDIDSFLTFLNLVDLKATLFTIPVKPQYLWGFVLVTAQVMMVLVQMEYLAKDSVWL